MSETGFKEIEFEIRGLAPLMCHNGQMADPTNFYTKELKKLTGKKTKTDDDYAQMAEIEWEGGLYLNEKEQPIIPGANLESAFVMGGKKMKKGKQFQGGLICDGDWVIRHDGPKMLAGLKADRNFRDTRGVRNPSNRARIMRTRPIFQSWGLKFSVMFLPDILNEQEVRDTLVTVGRIIGLGDFIPKYGRFRVV